jgi:hypothetical protein
VTVIQDSEGGGNTRRKVWRINSDGSSQVVKYPHKTRIEGCYAVKSYDMVKIGRSRDLITRVSSIINVCPGRNGVVMGLSVCDPMQELYHHDMLKQYRVSGEWFRWCVGVHNHICKHFVTSLKDLVRMGLR